MNENERFIRASDDEPADIEDLTTTNIVFSAVLVVAVIPLIFVKEDLKRQKAVKAALVEETSPTPEIERSRTTTEVSTGSTAVPTEVSNQAEITTM